MMTLAQLVDVCHARCVVIIGNEFKGIDKNDDQENKEVDSDLYVVLAALEVDALVNVYINRLNAFNRTAPLPIVIQEIYNESTATFLPDSYSLKSKTSHGLDTYDIAPRQNGRGISYTKDMDDNADHSEFTFGVFRLFPNWCLCLIILWCRNPPGGEIDSEVSSLNLTITMPTIRALTPMSRIQPTRRFIYSNCYLCFLLDFLVLCRTYYDYRAGCLLNTFWMH